MLTTQLSHLHRLAFAGSVNLTSKEQCNCSKDSFPKTVGVPFGPISTSAISLGYYMQEAPVCIQLFYSTVSQERIPCLLESQLDPMDFLAPALHKICVGTPLRTNHSHATNARASYKHPDAHGEIVLPVTYTQHQHTVHLHAGYEETCLKKATSFRFQTVAVECWRGRREKFVQHTRPFSALKPHTLWPK